MGWKRPEKLDGLKLERQKADLQSRWLQEFAFEIPLYPMYSHDG